MWRFVVARRHKICPKSTFCICLCTKHMENAKFCDDLKGGGGQIDPPTPPPPQVKTRSHKAQLE